MLMHFIVLQSNVCNLMCLDLIKLDYKQILNKNSIVDGE